MPARQALAVEEQFPTGGLLRIGQRIELRSDISRRETKRGDNGKNQCQPADVFQAEKLPARHRSDNEKR
jgi:hypothetical protein